MNTRTTKLGLLVAVAAAGMSTAWALGWVGSRVEPATVAAAPVAALAARAPVAAQVAAPPAIADVAAPTQAASESAPTSTQSGKDEPIQPAPDRDPAADIQASLDALQTTCSSSTPPTPTPGDPPPGAWWNPHRWGTGWTLAYDNNSPKMRVVWHTFYPVANGGGQTWLMSDNIAIVGAVGGARTWTSSLYRTRWGQWGGTPVGTVTISFPSDSATHASIVWHWDSDNGTATTFTGNECIYAYNLDGPAATRGPSLTPGSLQPAVPAGTAVPQGNYYTGIWADPSTPGFAVEVAGISPSNTELNTLSIYDLNTNKPLWLWAQIGPQSHWPLPGWVVSSNPDDTTEVDVGYRTAKYNMANTDCSDKAACVNETMYSRPANYFGRAYHRSSDGTLNDAVMGLKVSSSTPISIAWPPAKWPAAPAGSDLSGCTKGSQICRPLKRTTDAETLTVLPRVCDTPTPTSTCTIALSWVGSIIGVVQRLNADTQQLQPHGTDGGVIGGGIWGSFTDTLSADERVIYRLKIGNRNHDVGARAGYSQISATSPCVMPAGSNVCQTTVTWRTPDADDATSQIYVFRAVSTNGGAPTESIWMSRDSIGTATDTVQRGQQIYYTVKRLTGVTYTWLASTSSTPTVPIDAYVNVSPTQCSVPLNQTTCPIGVTWQANAANAQIQRIDLVNGAAPVTIASGVSGTATDNLPRDSHVQYIVKVGSAEQARSTDVSAITSVVTTSASTCVVISGQNTCTIYVSWTSTSGAIVQRVDEVSAARTTIGSGFTGVNAPDPLDPGVRVHYELMIGGVVHAITPTVTTSTDGEGGDSSTGSAEAVPTIAPFAEPALDSDSDRVGAIAGEFRVDEGGNATYRIPLAVPPGSGGVSPSLALSYNSGAGDSALGTGFALDGLSAITPCRPNFEAGDVGSPTADPGQFCLDGQRLLLVGGAHRQVNAEYRTEIDTFQRIRLTAIESVSVASALRTAYVFTVEGKDGSTRTFGGAAGTVFGMQTPMGDLSRTASSQAPQATVSVVLPQAWLQTQSRDVANNAITFAYSAVTTLGERTLQNVSYSGGSVAFSYTASPRVETVYSYIGARTQSQLVSGIEVKNKEGATLRYYAPTYNTSSTWQRYRPHLTSIQECASLGGACYPATTFTWSEASPQVQVFEGNMTSGLGYYQFGDFNGDKRADLWWTSGSQGQENNLLHISAFTSDSTTGAPTLREVFTNDRLLPNGYVNGGLWEVFDYDGDGRDDLLFAWNNCGGTPCANPTQMSWILRRSTGTGLGPEEVKFSVPLNAAMVTDISNQIAAQTRSPDHPDGVLELLGSSMRADVDGDGQPDFIFRASDGKFWIALTTLSGSTSAPYALNPIQAAFLDENGNPVTNSRCGFATSNLMRKEESYSQATDFDGDGRADLRFVIDARQCASVGTSGGFRLDVFLSKGVRTSDGKFVFQASRPFGDVSVSADGIADAGQKLRTLDVNGDGLTDLVYNGTDNIWHFRLGGPFSAQTDACVADCTLSYHIETTQMFDFDGDGKLDFWARSTAAHTGTEYQVYLWGGSNWVLVPGTGLGIPTGYHIPGDDWTRIAADFDGDGMVDNFFVKSDTGHWYLQRSDQHHQSRGMITQIATGLGAATNITYGPLTYSSLYRRDYDAPFKVSGRGSPVFDMAAPSFVVKKVASSAPTQGHADAQSSVNYRYAGMKVQGGGRGSLGFRRMSSLDTQTGVEVDTYYEQRFPYSGLAELTDTRDLGSGGFTTRASDVCATAPDAPTCMMYVAPCSAGLNTTCDDDLPNSGKTIKESADQWRWRAGTRMGALGPICAGATCTDEGTQDRAKLAAAQVPIFVARIESLTSNYDPAIGQAGSAIATDALEMPLENYDAYGNPGTSTSSKSGGGTAVGTSSVMAYDNYVDTATWKLGRLSTSTVQTTRTAPGSSYTNVRKSSFTYDAVTRMLASEKVEGMTGTFPSPLNVDASAPTATKYYAYDSFGNRKKTSVCTADVGEATCRALIGGGSTYQFHPTGTTTVMRYSSTFYDSTGRFADALNEAYSGGGTASYEFAAMVDARNVGGDPTEMDTVNGVRTKVRYGVMGRKRYTWAENGANTRWDARYCTGLPAAAGLPTLPCPSGMSLAYISTTTSAGAPTAMTYYDVLGRPTIALTQAFANGGWNGVITQYDDTGNVQRISDPYPASNSGAGAASPVAGSAITWTESTYDTLNRPTQYHHTGTGATTTIAYDGLKTTTTLPANVSGLAQTLSEYRNGLGEIVKTVDANGLAVETTYDAGGNAAIVRRGTDVTTTIFDTLGRKTGLIDPDAGSWTYAVNGVGETIRQTSPRGTCVTSEYDGRGRVWHRRDYSNGTCTTLETDASWAYDRASYGVGLLGQETNSQVTRTFMYDSLSRAIGTQTVEDGKTYSEQWNYDQFGRGYQHFFTAPGLATTGERNLYTPTGFVSQTRSAYPLNDGSFPVYREIQAVNARGQVTGERTAARAEYLQQREYDVNTGRLTRLLAQSTSTGLLQDLAYDYDLVGNVKSRTQHTPTLAMVENFGYDSLQRLTSGSVTSGGVTSYARSQSYFDTGNLNYKNDAGNYVYGTRPSGCAGTDAVPGPHAVSDVGVIWFCYDKNGNVVKQINKQNGSRVQTITYTAADQASDIVHNANNARVGFGYGPNRERVRRLDYASSVATTADTVVHETGGAQMRYVATSTNGAGQMLEVRRYVGNVLIVQTGSGGSYRLKRQILLSDAQGGTHQVLGAMTLLPTNAATPTSFDAWGARRAGDTWSDPAPWTQTLEPLLRATTTHGYTGHEMAESVGVIHMNGRIYDPHFARFLQADPFVQSPGNAQSWNRYAYGFNNPLVFTDPTGYSSAGDYLRIAAAIVITVYSGGAAAGSWGFLGLSAAEASANAYAVIAIGGFAAGAVQTGTLRGAVTGAVSAAAFYGVGNYFSANGGGAALMKDSPMMGYAARTLASGAVGGVMSSLQGGRFGSGFASAGASAALSPAVEGMDSTPAQVVAIAAIGGTTSVLAGGKFANGAVTASFGYAFAQAANAMEAASSSTSDVSSVELPSSVKVEAQGFSTREDAARGAAAAYGQEGVRRQQEVQLGLSEISTNDWGYLTPGWGPAGATRVDPAPLMAQYKKADLSVNAWMHGHFDSQLNFSAVDFSLAWGRPQPTYLVNSAGEVRVMTGAQLKSALGSLPMDNKIRGLDGLKAFYEKNGFPGDKL